jgi:hypothetical protein
MSGAFLFRLSGTPGVINGFARRRGRSVKIRKNRTGYVPDMVYWVPSGSGQHFI